MKISLATVHAKPAFTPLALMYLKAMLLKRELLGGGDIRILEFAGVDSADTIAHRALDGGTTVVGLSCYVWNIRTLLAACARIKELRPDVFVVLGGPEVGPVARSVLEQHPSVDCVVKSEGEIPFAEIVARKMDGGDLAQVKGIALRRGTGIIDTEPAAVLQDLNVLASPHRMLESDPKGRYICIETQRGCVFRCNFCFYNKDLSIRNRRFDLDRVKDEILYWLQRDIADIYLMDPVFNLYAARAKEICRFIAANNPRRISIHTEVWAEFIDEEMARLMREAHFRYLEVGLQTTDSAVLATVERRLKLARFVEGIEHLKRFDIPFEVQLIYGLPGETRASFRASLNFAASLRAPDLAVFPLMVLPGTELRRKADVLGIEFDPDPPYYVRSHRSMNESDIDYGNKVADAVDRIGNAWTIRLLARETGVTFVELIDEWLTWVEGNLADDAACDKESIRQFIAHFCALKRIPPRFYERSADLEFRAQPVAA